MKLYTDLLRNFVLLATITAMVACIKPEPIEPEKPVTKNWPNIWKLSQTTQDGGGIIYNVQIIEGYLYIFANTTSKIRVNWRHPYWETNPEYQFHYWTDHCPNGQPIKIYLPSTISISAESTNYGGQTPNLEMQINRDPTSLPWYSTQLQIHHPDNEFRPLESAPWAQPTPTHPMGWSTTYVTRYETRMYDITKLNE